MKILIVGSGGREHAIAWKLKQSPGVDELFIAPGNGGTAACGVNVDIKDSDLDGLVAFAGDKDVDLVVAGPELPLVLGLRDRLDEVGIPCFGPDKFASQLEGSKSFAKKIMREAGVPTADFELFTDYEAAKAHVLDKGAPLVVKADGLAAGKGVIVCQTTDQALEALDQIMVQRAFGDAGDTVVVEEALTGEEASFLAFCDGKTCVAMPSSQDHKPVGEGDTGPNTGGMGAYSPAPILPMSEHERMRKLVIDPIVKRMAELGSPFVGMLYAGLMIDGDQVKVLEYNVRFGDPECQPLLMRLDTDLAEIMQACVQGRLDKLEIKYRPETAICVVMAAKGYPGGYAKGMPITNLEEAEALGDVMVFQAGTAKTADGVVSSGGRVLGVTALGTELAQAKDLAYQAVDAIGFPDSYVRRDIGEKGIQRLKS